MLNEWRIIQPLGWVGAIHHSICFLLGQTIDSVGPASFTSLADLLPFFAIALTEKGLVRINLSANDLRLSLLQGGRSLFGLILWARNGSLSLPAVPGLSGMPGGRQNRSGWEYFAPA